MPSLYAARESRPPAPGAGAAMEEWLEGRLGERAVPPLLVVIGLGRGDILEAIERRAPAARVLAFEPDAAVADVSRGHPAIRAWTGSGRLLRLCDPDYAGGDQAWRLFPPDPNQHALLVHPLIERDMPPGAVRALKAFRQILFGARANAEARRRLAPRYLANTLRNLPAIVHGRDVRTLEGVFRGVPAVVVGAGPSLDGALETLRARRAGAVVIAADTALRPLAWAGLAPQIVVGVDPGAANARHFQALPSCPGTWLVAESALDPAAVRRFDGRTFWFRAARHHPWPWLNELGIDVASMDLWGSVLTGAFQVAILAGCDPIVFAGADLAFTGGQPYTRGTTYEFDWARSAALGRTVGDIWRAHREWAKAAPSVDLHGAETPTTEVLRSYRNWLVARAAQCRRRIVNATANGILFGPGLEQAAMDEVLARHGGGVPRRPLPAARIAIDRTHDIRQRLRTLSTAIARGETPPPVGEWIAFTGEPDAMAAGAALRAALRELAASGHAAAEEPPPAAFWEQAMARRPARAVMAHLPEAIGRLSAAFDGRRPAGVLPDTQREALLEEAFDLLRSLGNTVRAAGDGSASPLDADVFARTPLSAVAAWPEATSWAIAVFEAMLGDALDTAVAASSFAFYGRPEPPDAAAPAGERLEDDRGTHAVALLVLEWLLAAGIHPGWLRGIAAALRLAARSPAPIAGVSLAVDAAADGWRRSLDMPLRVSSPALATILTGSLTSWAEAPAAVELAPSRIGRLAVTSRLRLGAGTPRASLVPPKVPTVARATLAYRRDDGVVCVAPHTTRSFVVREDGTVEPHVEWPRPITGEARWGDAGLVAWSNGTHRWPVVVPAYVMFREHPSSRPAIVELPFRPSIATRWRNRIYWTCFSSGVGAFTGVASWAPGGEARFEVEGPQLFACIPDGEALRLEPCVLKPGGGFERRLLREGLRWTPGQPPAAVALGPDGARSSVEEAGGWTATAYPDLDRIRLSRADGRVLALVCHRPFRLAWTGRSLVVTTADRDVLLFERLLDRAAAWGG
ncbi:MAG: DUF115 domain-containing protein [Acidobacteria bacterium]|nr:DUF115 domain-containing protein [Acidobacteriota bacterium]